MKKLFALILISVMLVTSCAEAGNSGSDDGSTSAPATTTYAPTNAPIYSAPSETKAPETKAPETKAPEGYQLLRGPAYEGSITSDDTLRVELTVVNAPIFELPMTGSTGSMAMRLLQISGAAVLLLALLYIVKKRR